MIVSGRQQRNSAIHKNIYILPHTPLLSRLPHNIELCSLEVSTLIIATFWNWDTTQGVTTYQGDSLGPLIWNTFSCFSHVLGNWTVTKRMLLPTCVFFESKYIEAQDKKWVVMCYSLKVRTKVRVIMTPSLLKEDRDGWGGDKLLEQSSDANQITSSLMRSGIL